MIMGAAVVDLAVIGREAVRRVQARRGAPRAPVQAGGLSSGRLLAWVIVWGVALVLVATLLLGQPVGYVLLRAGAGVPVRVRERHLHRHLGLEPDLQRLRRIGADDVGARARARRSWP